MSSISSSSSDQSPVLSCCQATSDTTGDGGDDGGEGQLRRYLFRARCRADSAARCVASPTTTHPLLHYKVRRY